MRNRLAILQADIRAAHDAATRAAQAEAGAKAGRSERASAARSTVSVAQADRRVAADCARLTCNQLTRLQTDKCATVAHLGLRAALREISAPRRIHGRSTVAGIQSENDPLRIVIRMNSGRRVILHATGTELPPDISFLKPTPRQSVFDSDPMRAAFY